MVFEVTGQQATRNRVPERQEAPQPSCKQWKSALASRLPDLGSRAESLGSPRQLRCAAQGPKQQVAVWRENSGGLQRVPWNSAVLMGTCT